MPTNQTFSITASSSAEWVPTPAAYERIAEPDPLHGEPKRFWYAFRVARGKELEAEAVLAKEELALAVSVPARVTRGKRGKGRFDRVRRNECRVAWPGHVFVLLASEPSEEPSKPPPIPADDIQTILKVDHIRASVPGRIKEKHMAEWLASKEMSDWLAGKEDAPKPPQFEVGENVVVTAGQFASFSGPITEMREKTAKVLVDVFGRPVEAIAPISKLRKNRPTNRTTNVPH